MRLLNQIKEKITFPNISNRVTLKRLIYLIAQDLGDSFRRSQYFPQRKKVFHKERMFQLYKSIY